MPVPFKVSVPCYLVPAYYEREGYVGGVNVIELGIVPIYTNLIAFCASAYRPGNVPCLPMTMLPVVGCGVRFLL